ncbi:MAG TPA: DUF2231 domain-containing protein [Actinomycetota bacterium]|nr:DUF2231 domain-containing protein [Actinomycetota bacterium]
MHERPPYDLGSSRPDGRSGDAGRTRAGRTLHCAAEVVESAGGLDAAAAPLHRLGRALRASAAGDALRGAWLGHALHPMATDFPLGAWMSASLLDLIGGPDAREAARRLVAFGLVMAAPTVASGVAEIGAAPPRARRVGVVHAAVNLTATALYAASFVARTRGAHRRGAALGIAGGLCATAGGYFGGHLSLENAVGVDRTHADASSSDAGR